MYFLCLCCTVQSSLLFVFACRNGRTPSRRMQVSPSSSWWTRAGGWRRFQFHSQSLGCQPLSASPVLHHFMDPLLKSLQPCWWGGSLWFWAGRGGEREKKNQWWLGGGWSGAWESEGGLSLSSSLRSISARPSGVWGEEGGEVEGERPSDQWFPGDTWEMPLDFLLSFCQCLSLCFIFLSLSLLSVAVLLFSFFSSFIPTYKPSFFSLIRFSPFLISFTYKPFGSRYWSLAWTIPRAWSIVTPIRPGM